ncbi:MAG TPA: alginate export family protein [Candidatus Hydrogenedentes bacterium]|nr:alginate export family protein [Candidatus Hydrogenedentota bacterium]
MTNSGSWRVTARKAVLLAMVAGLTGMARADLQNVQTGGRIVIRGRWIHNTFNESRAAVLHNGFPSLYAWDETNDWTSVEQATSWHARADFTGGVSAFVEFYAYHFWGDGFRSDYLGGIDARPGGDPRLNASLLQGYVETNDTFGLPLRLRIGRQCMTFGKQLLISDHSSPVQRFSFDALRATFTPVDKVTIDVWMAQLAESSPEEKDGDSAFYGVYATYAKSDAANASLYYLLLRDARRADAIFSGAPDLYEPTVLNTAGARFWGRKEGFDYDVEAAFQFGPADGEALAFASANRLAGAPPKGERWNNLGFDGEIGYSFDAAWKPRIFAGGLYFEGGEIEDLGGGRFVMGPSFNRLFSVLNYCPVLQDNGNMSNFVQLRAGMNFAPLEKVQVTVRGQQLWAEQSWRPLHSSDNLGFHLDTTVRYSFNPNLLVQLYYGHLFSGAALGDGNFTHAFGNAFDAGRNSRDADYAYWMLTLDFRRVFQK